MAGLRRNGVSVFVQKWDSHKLPVLAVQIEDENCLYKVASFNSEETAQWFVDVMKEFFDGMVKDDEPGTTDSIVERRT